jgi:hypothetical protein
VLARFDKIAGVEMSLANRTGTMVRVALTAKADREKVAAEVQKILTDQRRKPVPVTGDELKAALAREEWFESKRIGELSSIEFSILALRARVKKFARTEKLDKAATEKLVKIAEDQWNRLNRPPAKDKGKPGDNNQDQQARGEKLARAVAEEAKELLTAEQSEKLMKAILDGSRSKE